MISRLQRERMEQRGGLILAEGRDVMKAIEEVDQVSSAPYCLLRVERESFNCTPYLLRR